MGKIIAGMSVSLDGFINDENGGVGKLYSDFKELHEVASFKEMLRTTGAAVMGRHTYDMADPFSWANDNYEFQTPIFVLTHTPPEKYPAGNGRLSFIFIIEGIERAISEAKKATGNRDVQIIGGANIIQQALNSGLCDELVIDSMSVLLGKGVRLFENIRTDRIELQRLGVEEMTSVRTSIRFKVRGKENITLV